MEKKVNEQQKERREFEEMISERLRVEERLQNEIKWLKVEIKESRREERLHALESNWNFMYIGLLAYAVITLIVQ